MKAIRTHARRVPGKMNATEARYAQVLDLRARAGEIAWYAYEGLTFKLADNTRFTPDFVLVTDTGQIEVHEVKGFWRDDARVKIKVAASLYPWAEFRACQPQGKGWQVEVFSPCEMPKASES